MVRRLLPLIALIIAVGLAPPATGQDSRLKVQLVGPDGKPTEKQFALYSHYGTNRPLMPDKIAGGDVIIVAASDTKGQVGETVVLVPNSGAMSVTVKVGSSPPSYWEHASSAKKASEAGDESTYNAEAWQATEALAYERDNLADERKVIEQWRDQNNLPPMTAAEVDAAIKSGKPAGIGEKSKAAQLLRRYKTYLTRLEDKEATLKSHEDDFKTLRPPEKKTTMAPGTCPNGEGGLLAGWINDMTGSDLAAACDIDATRDKNRNGKGGSQGNRDHHGHD